jgi:hypothetical protein
MARPSPKAPGSVERARLPPPLNIPFDGYSGQSPIVGSRGGRKQFHLGV